MEQHIVFRAYVSNGCRVCSVVKLGEFHFREVPRGSEKRLENKTLNGGFWGHFKLKIVNICYCFYFNNETTH